MRNWAQRDYPSTRRARDLGGWIPILVIGTITVVALVNVIRGVW